MIKIIGDVHLGKRFIENVPIHRRGERETLILEKFADELFKPGDIVVQMGDLFDSFTIDNRVLWDAYRYIVSASGGRNYYFLRGNHDASRDSDKISSWEILSVMLERYDTLKFIDQPTVVGEYGFMPWSPFHSAQEQAEELVLLVKEPLKAVFCHCDIKSYGGDDYNLLPYETLAKITNHVYTGHIHLPQEFERNGLKVTVTGSMQPYAHGEDPTSEWYVTMNKTAFESIHPHILRNKYVRVLLEEDEEAPEPIDCLGFSTKKMYSTEDNQDISGMETALVNLDSNSLLRTCLGQSQVPDRIIEQILEKFNAAQS